MNQRKPPKRQRKHVEQAAVALKPQVKAIPRIHEVVVECRDENDQQIVYERMCADGYRCRVLSL